jgi:hypothetical protein
MLWVCTYYQLRGTDIPIGTLSNLVNLHLLEASLHLGKTFTHLCLGMLDEVEVVPSFQPFDQAGKY